jgi:hypothetical protein
MAGIGSAAAAEDGHSQSTTLTTTVFASAGAIPGGKVVTNPDDITALDGSIFVSWQNGLGPNGEPAGNGVTQSTVSSTRATVGLPIAGS